MDDQTAFHALAIGLVENARDLEQDLDWFDEILRARLTSYFSAEEGVTTQLALIPPPLEDSHSPYASFVRQSGITPAARLLLLLALAPHLRPQALDVLWLRNETLQRGYAQLGGTAGAHHGGFLPTGETACFLLAGEDLTLRFEVCNWLEGGAEGPLREVVRLANAPSGEPALSGALMVSPHWLRTFTTGASHAPAFGPDFPARRVHTELAWKDLVLGEATLAQLDEVRQWLLHSHTLLVDWGMRDRLRAGYVCLFHGPSGTGKTLAACLLGKHCGRPVYKVDLSMVVSKYIGETEKNLAKVFDAAQSSGWILFFDEADALFSKRSRVENAHDRYANQEVSFLLQRIEDFDGVVILASNLRANVDDAFLRRFHSVVHFPAPSAPERLRLWRSAIPARLRLHQDIDLERLAQRHELTGGSILNVLRHVALRAAARGETTLMATDVDEGVRRELVKEGRAL